MRTRFCIVSLIACTLFFFSACITTSSISKEIDDKKAFPEEFSKNSGTILVIRSKNGNYNRTIKHNFSKFYKGEYLIIKRSEIEAYKDYGKYRYLFDYDEQFIPGSGMGTSRTPAHNNYEFFLVDRITNKSYHFTYNHDDYGKWMKAFLLKLDALRAK